MDWKREEREQFGGDVERHVSFKIRFLI